MEYIKDDTGKEQEFSKNTFQIYVSANTIEKEPGGLGHNAGSRRRLKSWSNQL